MLLGLDSSDEEEEEMWDARTVLLVHDSWVLGEVVAFDFWGASHCQGLPASVVQYNCNRYTGLTAWIVPCKVLLGVHLLAHFPCTLCVQHCQVCNLAMWSTSQGDSSPVFRYTCLPVKVLFPTVEPGMVVVVSPHDVHFWHWQTASSKLYEIALITHKSTHSLYS